MKLRNLIDQCLSQIQLSSTQSFADIPHTHQLENEVLTIILEYPSNLSTPIEALRPTAQQALTDAFPSYSVRLITTSTRAPAQGIKHLIAVASGKGGVGKSTTALNLALAFAQQGKKVGILDADIYGPSLPKMLNLNGKPKLSENKKLIPLQQYNLQCMSIGFLVPEESPMIWRGPMVQSALKQLLKDVEWGELDILVIDMPPGTGDVHLTLAQQAQLHGAVIVSTPQDIALIDARKSIHMFERVAIPILGIIENMSQFCCPQCGTLTPIFSQGGAEMTASKMNIPFLGALPLDMAIRVGADEGQPFMETYSSSSIGLLYQEMASKIWQSLEFGQVNKPKPAIHIS